MKKIHIFMLFLLAAFAAQAADITMTADDTFSQTSFNTGLHWPGGLAPSAGNNYFTGDFTLRTPADGGSYTFAGDSLTVNNTSAYPDGLFYKGTGAPSTLTINNLILNGGIISHGNGTTHICRFEGNISVIANSQIWAKQGPIDVYSVISGSGTITNPSSDSGPCVLTFYSSASTFTGSIVNNGRFTLADNAVLNFVIGADGVNNSVSGTGAATVFNGDFNIDLTGAGTLVGNSWAIVTASNRTFGSTFTVVGFTDMGDNTWQKDANGVAYQFDEGTGILSVYIPQLHEDPIAGVVYDAEYNVPNGHMTLPGSIVNPGWDGESGPDIPGWTAIAAGTTNGGTGGGGTGDSADGDGWHAAVQSIDPDVYNIADANFVEGVTYTFTGQFAPRWGLIGGAMSVIADDDPNILLATAPITFPEGVDHTATFYPASVSYTATASDAGKKIGIYLDALGTAGWLRFDDIHLYSGYLERHGAIDQAPDGTDLDPVTPLVFSWTPTNDPNFDGPLLGDDQVLCYYIGNGDGSDPDYASYVAADGLSMTNLGGGYNVGTYNTGVGITTDQYCLWRVDTIINDVPYTGKTILFTTRSADLVPVLTPGANWITWVGEQVTLTASVNDSGESDVADADNVWSLVNSAPWAAVMQMYDRSGYTAELAALEGLGYDPDLFEDWIGTDARGQLSAAEPLTVTLSGVPSGTYTWTSYHHDMFDQTGPFNVTVIDASGSTPYTGLDVTNGTQEPNQVFTAAITSNGSPIQLVFDNTGTANNTSFFVMNGFDLVDGVNPDLKVDFGLATTGIAAGYQAYIAEHEVEASFTAQNFSALGTTVTVTPSWNTSSYYATLTKVPSGDLAPEATFVSNWPADYTIRLDSTDRGGSLGDQAAVPVTMTVRVAADTCAAKQLETPGYHYYDHNDDCVVGLVDLADFALYWLNDINLTAPVTY